MASHESSEEEENNETETIPSLPLQHTSHSSQFTRSSRLKNTHSHTRAYKRHHHTYESSSSDSSSSTSRIHHKTESKLKEVIMLAQQTHMLEMQIQAQLLEQSKNQLYSSLQSVQGNRLAITPSPIPQNSLTFYPKITSPLPPPLPPPPSPPLVSSSAVPSAYPADVPPSSTSTSRPFFPQKTPSFRGFVPSHPSTRKRSISQQGLSHSLPLPSYSTLFTRIDTAYSLPPRTSITPLTAQRERQELEQTEESVALDALTAPQNEHPLSPSADISEASQVPIQQNDELFPEAPKNPSIADTRAYSPSQLLPAQPPRFHLKPARTFHPASNLVLSTSSYFIRSNMHNENADTQPSETFLT